MTTKYAGDVHVYVDSRPVQRCLFQIQVFIVFCLG